MKRKRKHKPSAADRLADAQERIAKALEELAKKPPVVIPAAPPIIVQPVRWPYPGDDFPPGAPVQPWRPAPTCPPYVVTCQTGTSSPATNGTAITWTNGGTTQFQ
jgi:hypothetical protein